ncbi:MAG: glycine--tRNA ligase subunit beta, partial [Campylobacterota bacterium]|nr:glycine--tRNA ligase subunit beta [Campylobacterota bacterium]
MLKPLLIEIGVEELPAIPLLKELPNIEKKYSQILEKYSLLCEFEFFYTPRRLVLWHSEFKVAQEDSVEEFFGAPLAIAYKDGVATKAAEGFARKCGVTLEELSSTMKGSQEVLYYKKDVKGESSINLLQSIVDEWLNSLNFGKSMRWGSLSESFIRPIRWVNVVLGKDVVDMEIFSVKSEKATYIHRDISFELQKFDDIENYFDILRDGFVNLYQDKRRKSILDEFIILENENSIDIEVDSDLIEEIIAITEYPSALLGSFDSKFLELPSEVIITSMKEHQRYFPVFKDGKLLNKFVVVTNSCADDTSKVISGNEKVLRPRLADGLFFYNNDLKRGLINDGLEKVIFMKGAGSLEDKIEREKSIASALIEHYKIDEVSTTYILRALNLAKADLMSEMVYEFTELQGIMGSYYAKATGEEPDVVNAIKEQYLPQGEDSSMPSSIVSAIVALSIKLDTLLTLFSVGEIPTGTRDPFALRRAVNGIMRICLAYKLEFNIVTTLSMLSEKYEKEIDLKILESFFLERVNQFFKVNPSIIKAVLSSGEREIIAIDKKIEAVSNIVQSDTFSTIFSTFKRLANITKDLDLNETLKIDTLLFEDDAEKNLFDAYSKVEVATFASYEQNLDALFDLKTLLDDFF